MKLQRLTGGLLVLALPLFLSACKPQESKAVDPETGSNAASTDMSEAEAACCAEDALAAAGVLPDTSLYNLESRWTDQVGIEHELNDFRGTVTIAAMIFTHCEYACPRIIADLKAIEGTLTKDDLSNVKWLLLSMDSDRDKPAVLKAYAERNNLDTDRWTLMHGDDSAVRELGATLGVRYKKDAKGNYAHSNLITLLDKEGRISHQLEGLGANNQETVTAVQALIQP